MTEGVPETADARPGWFDRISLGWIMLTVTVVVFMIAGAWYLTWDTNKIVQGHNAELAKISQTLDEVHHFEATAASNHTGSVDYLAAICASTPGCPQRLATIQSSHP